MHCLTGINAEELGDGMSHRARRRDIAHLYGYARAAIPVFLEADESGRVNFRIGQRFPGDQFIGNILGYARLEFVRAVYRSFYFPGRDVIHNRDLLDVVHEQREILEVTPETVDLVDGREDGDRLIDSDAVLAHAEPEQAAGIEVGYPTRGQDQTGCTQDRFDDPSAGQTVEGQQAAADTAQQACRRRPVA